MTVTLRSTIRQVAERAGVSRMTVSRVLKGRDEQVSEKTRKRVLAAVHELEYVPVAQPITQSRHIETRIIGLVFDGTPMESPFGLPTFFGLREGAKKYDYDLLTLLRDIPEWMFGKEELQFLNRRCDGIIFISPQNRSKTIEILSHHNIPVVRCYVKEAPETVPCILSDNLGSMYNMTRLLIENGHTRIMHVAPCTKREDFKMRKQGYAKAMEEQNLDPVIFELDYKQEHLVREFFQLIEQHGITALNCFSDTQAFHAWNLCAANGIKIPQEMSITGMDNASPEAVARGLTTAAVPFEQIGKRAFKMMMDIIEGSEELIRDVVLPTQIIERTSIYRVPHE